MTTATRRTTERLAAVALVAGLTASCGTDAQAGDGGPQSDEGGRVINVETTTLGPRSFTEHIRLTGTVEANRDVTVSAEESGVVREILVEKGTPVSAGRPLVRIDDRVLASQVDEARARAELARQTWDRRKRLWEEDGIGTELAYLEARFAAEQAEAQLRALEERLARTTVTAPIAGVLDDRFVEVGTMVSPGVPVARIVDLDPVKVTAGVPERYAADVARGARATVAFDVLEERTFQGTVSYVGSSVNPSNRTFPVELTLPNPGRAIKPEMVADVSLVRRELDDVLVVPQEALVRVEDGFVAFVVVEGDGGTVAEARSLVTGPAQRNHVVIRQGLRAGDRLVVSGQQMVAAGDRVRVVGER